MSRAFTKENDSDDDELPPRQHSDLPNYITPKGLAQVESKVDLLRKELSEYRGQQDYSETQKFRWAQRDLRYLEERLRRAILISPVGNPTKVAFGVTVRAVDESDQEHQFSLVGEDETDLDRGHISWASPLAGALIGKCVGDIAMWPKADGVEQLEIIAIDAISE